MMEQPVNGYCILIIGHRNHMGYRIVFKKHLDDALKALPELKKEGRVEVLHIVNSDTQIQKEEEDYVDEQS